MKNKTATYALLVLSVVIWGIIAWKVFSTFNHKTQEKKADIRMIPAQKKDTILLLLNYRDPFLGKLSGNNPREDTTRNHVQHMPVIEVIPDFKYKGMITVGGKISVLINKGGEEMVVSPQDNIGEFSIIKVNNEELIVRRKGRSYNLLIE
ncbi:MAG: hypothetical protein AB2L24_23755 [Mangrovibacterium sp.]